MKWKETGLTSSGNMLTSLDPSSCCQVLWPATCSQNAGILRETVNIACSRELQRNLPFFLGPLRKCQRVSATEKTNKNCWTRKQNQRKGLGGHTTGFPLFFICRYKDSHYKDSSLFVDIKILTENFITYIDKHIFASFHPFTLWNATLRNLLELWRVSSWRAMEQ